MCVHMCVLYMCDVFMQAGVKEFVCSCVYLIAKG